MSWLNNSKTVQLLAVDWCSVETSMASTFHGWTHTHLHTHCIIHLKDCVEAIIMSLVVSLFFSVSCFFTPFKIISGVHNVVVFLSVHQWSVAAHHRGNKPQVMIRLCVCVNGKANSFWRFLTRWGDFVGHSTQRRTDWTIGVHCCSETGGTTTSCHRSRPDRWGLRWPLPLLPFTHGSSNLSEVELLTVHTLLRGSYYSDLMISHSEKTAQILMFPSFFLPSFLPICSDPSPLPWRRVSY